VVYYNTNVDATPRAGIHLATTASASNAICTVTHSFDLILALYWAVQRIIGTETFPYPCSDLEDFLLCYVEDHLLASSLVSSE
jgi:hypothetical protein